MGSAQRNDHSIFMDQGRGCAAPVDCQFEVGLVGLGFFEQLMFPSDRSGLEIDAEQMSGCGQSDDERLVFVIHDGRSRSRSESSHGMVVPTWALNTPEGISI